ncbi:DEXDc domain containing protein [uncultured Caudovirales phage]|uniref:DEXDc domain containing protein n=1 Tax=uncultured Caudovirales phage TaxID=2100421 RepID=A0A6J5PZP5_9CAUD|nr:DEXDc domain containing protein [uncultured Caudovirales phage]CAB4199096.1 DEXDc domain containing protein [uncultured Caudovirales phage]CAB4213083.1 DEXDc domain containing protein [uncultured Caudovirales phage]CAB5228098.1 DEXDc domain containing protein [uncultured Caudovirales phage]
MSYASFLRSKLRKNPAAGLKALALPSMLYVWQAAIVRWALARGRAAIFADCGLGKTFMQVAWASQVPGSVIILAPLCVAEQTIREARALGIVITYVEDDAAAAAATTPIVITNYERLQKIDVRRFAGVVLDESSILKAFDGATRTRLIEVFADTPYRLCCTATPSPNDITELANHAEFLGLMTRPEFLATWFVRVQDGKKGETYHGWRMKRHAVQPFYRWMATWAIAFRSPADLGYDASGFTLPPLRIHDVVVSSDDGLPFDGTLFSGAKLNGIHGRLRARRGSLDLRVERAAALTNRASVHGLNDIRQDQYLVWCGLNDEADGVTAQVPGAVNVQGSDTAAEKIAAVEAFLAGEIRVLVTKAKILGFGMNFQHCHQHIFVGLSDSYETYYQCIRRSYRYGQQHPVDAYIVVSDTEAQIVDNVRRKEQNADVLTRELLQHMPKAVAA